MKRIHHTFTGAHERQPMPHKRLMLGSIAMVIGLALIQLILANSYVSKGTDLAISVGEREDLVQENDILRAKLASLTSLQTITEQAHAQGMIEAKNIVFVAEKPDTQPIAMEPTARTQ